MSTETLDTFDVAVDVSGGLSARALLPHTAVTFSTLLAFSHGAKMPERAASASRRAPPRQGRLVDTEPELVGLHFCKAIELGV